MVNNGMTICPECSSAKTEIILTMHDDSQDDNLTTIIKYRCLDCGCEFELVERWEIETKVTKHARRQRIDLP
jgi:hypothetical protein